MLCFARTSISLVSICWLVVTPILPERVSVCEVFELVAVASVVLWLSVLVLSSVWVIVPEFVAVCVVLSVRVLVVVDIVLSRSDIVLLS